MILLQQICTNKERETHHHIPHTLMLFPHYLSRVPFYLPSFLSHWLSLSICSHCFFLWLPLSSSSSKRKPMHSNTHCLINYSTTHPSPSYQHWQFPINNFPYQFYIYLNIFIYLVGLFEVDQYVLASLIPFLTCTC